MLYFVQQKRGNNPHSRLNVVKSATFRAMFLGLKPISPKLLHKIQHSPSSGAKRPENVAFFAGFVASMCPGRTYNLMNGERIALCAGKEAR
jgi:hypothetical protein